GWWRCRASSTKTPVGASSAFASAWTTRPTCSCCSPSEAAGSTTGSGAWDWPALLWVSGAPSPLTRKQVRLWPITASGHPSGRCFGHRCRGCWSVGQPLEQASADVRMLLEVGDGLVASLTDALGPDGEVGT